MALSLFQCSVSLGFTFVLINPVTVSKTKTSYHLLSQFLFLLPKVGFFTIFFLLEALSHRASSTKWLWFRSTCGCTSSAKYRSSQRPFIYQHRCVFGAFPMDWCYTTWGLFWKKEEGWGKKSEQSGQIRPWEAGVRWYRMWMERQRWGPGREWQETSWWHGRRERQRGGQGDTGMADDLCSSNWSGHVPGKISFVRGRRKDVVARHEMMWSLAVGMEGKGCVSAMVQRKSLEGFSVAWK